MTRKQFELVARALKESRPSLCGLSISRNSAARNQWEKTVWQFGVMCINLNPNFNHKKFLDAVGWDIDEGVQHDPQR
jgi:hypothetical protein